MKNGRRNLRCLSKLKVNENIYSYESNLLITEKCVLEAERKNRLEKEKGKGKDKKGGAADKKDDKKKDVSRNQ